MRIQHNIMAMNAYRNYNLNNKALSGNLEKLSSGYKINRAGDDAAGLAISEKMRAQITGLNAAQKNVKDGISLVKTAEGAMQEIQDMLNRMDYLATQSANGTYQDEVDREALQKEVNQLKDEIDRIADSANFNGIKLLDGSKDGTGASLKVAQGAAKAAAAKVAEMKTALDKANNMEVVGKDTPKDSAAIKAMFKTTTSTDPADVGSKTILETDFKPTDPVGFTIDLNGVDYVMGGDDTKAITLKIGADNTSITLTEAEMKANIDSTLAKGDKVTGEQLAKAIAAKYTAANGAAGTTITAEATKANKYKITANGTKLTFAALDNLDTDKNRHYDVKLTSDENATKLPTDAVASKYTAGALTAGGAVTKGETITLTVAYDRVNDDGTKSSVSKDISYEVQDGDAITDVGAGLIKAINDDAELSKYFVASGSNAGIVLEAQTAGLVDAKDDGGTVGAAAVTGLTVKSAGATTAATLGTAPTNAGDQVTGANAYTTGLGNSYVNAGTENIVQAGDDGRALLASTTLTLTSDVLKDGTLIELGGADGEKYRIAIGENSAYRGEKDATTGVDMYDGAKVVYLDKQADGSDPTAEQIASKLAEVAKDNAVFTVSHQAGSGNTIGLKQKAEAKEDTDMSTLDKFVDYVKISTKTTNTDQSAKNAAIAEAQANYDEAVAKQTAADAKVTELSKNPGKALQLQIGDTSDDWNQLQVNIGSMKTSALGIADLDIGTAEKASEAINIVKDAINNVSSVRGDLGAYQNRLDHTANNLSVMAENIQDAESTIRDTDVAEEMMSYVKNNILVQSAQAMLAQANQVPQGVLQLLG